MRSAQQPTVFCIFVSNQASRLCRLRLCGCRVRAAEEGWTFAKMATQAYMDRVDLSAHGFYATPEITGQCGVPGLRTVLQTRVVIHQHAWLVLGTRVRGADRLK